MRKLLITAHPNPNGFTHKIAKTFSTVSESCGHEIRVINLYDSDLRQDFLVLDAKNKPIDDPYISYMQEQITWAEEIIFVYPVWWYDAPAILKNWFDVNLTSGFAYKYKDNWLLPHQFLKGKKARFFVTTGSPTWLWYTPVGWGVWINMVVWRLAFVGIWTKSFTIFGNMIKYRDEKHRERFLAKVERVAKR